jgi:alpha-glucosidase
VTTINTTPIPPRDKRLWWRDYVTYQVYIRSFADANGDGKGDVAGIISRLPYLKKLGIDAIWITPWHPPPQKDHGYDVAGFMDIEPDYGTLADAKKLIEESHKLGIRLLVDIVPNHCSDQHKWFQEALAVKLGSKARDRFIFKDGKGENGDTPPNNWQAVFGGSAWQRVTEADGSAGQWYLHLFAVEQPDFNWQNQEVKDYFEKVLKFWLDLGVDGFRIDVAHGMIKAEGLPDVPSDPKLLEGKPMPFWDQDGVHEIYKEWRKILDSYPNDRMAVAEAWVHPATRIARYLRPGELMNSFNFEFLGSKWDVAEIKNNINKSIEAIGAVGAPSSWVFNNHDVVRSVDRFDLGLGLSGGTTLERQQDSSKFNLKRGQRRARAGALLMLALPGGAYIYQGEELTLPEAREIPEDPLSDPRWRMSDYKDRGRDGCRVPLPWRENSAGAFGFSDNENLTPNDAWLPQASNCGDFSVEAQETDPNSPLNLYRKALTIRKSLTGLGDGPMSWVDAPDQVVAFSRPGNFYCYLNFGADFKLPNEAQILVSSTPITDGFLPTDTTVWFTLK